MKNISKDKDHHRREDAECAEMCRMGGPNKEHKEISIRIVLNS